MRDKKDTYTLDLFTHTPQPKMRKYVRKTEPQAMVRRTDLRFDGADYSPNRDDARLTGQLLRIWNCMCGGSWKTLHQISAETGDPESSISAQLRHLRKERFGLHSVEKEYIRDGLYRYKLIVNTGKNNH